MKKRQEVPSALKMRSKNAKKLKIAPEPPLGAQEGISLPPELCTGSTSAPYPSGVWLRLFMPPNPLPGTCLLHPGSEIQSFLGKTGPVPAMGDYLYLLKTTPHPERGCSPQPQLSLQQPRCGFGHPWEQPRQLQAGNQCKPPPFLTRSSFPAKARPPQPHPRVERVRVMDGTHPCSTGGGSGIWVTPRPGKPRRSSKALSTMVIFYLT